jgi:hypothetical protein
MIKPLPQKDDSVNTSLKVSNVGAGIGIGSTSIALGVVLIPGANLLALGALAITSAGCLVTQVAGIVI